MSKNFSRDKLRMLRDKTKVAAIAFILVLTMATMLMAGSVANAQQTTVATHAFISVTPNPIGVGQQVYVDMWLIEVNPLAYTNMPSGTYSPLQYLWQNYTVLVTKPDGTTQTLGPYQAATISTVDVQYAVTQVGTYTFKFSFPGQLIKGLLVGGTTLGGNLSVNAFYAASSATTTLTVQQAPITPLPQNPVPAPTSYWQRPIDWQNQFWWTISGNWFASAQWKTPATFNPYTYAPQSAHVVWTKSISGPMAFGGQIGGALYSENDLSNYYIGKSYQTFFTPPIIINGVLFYNEPRGIQPNYGTYAVNLRTGQTLWYSNDTNEAGSMIVSGGTYGPTNGLPGVTYGEVFSHHNPNEVGGIAYLWGVSGTTWSLYDATTGNWILNVVNSPGGTAVTGPEGELLVYTLNAATGFLSMWNSTQCVGSTYWPINGWTWYPPTGSSLPWSKGIQWNVTVPTYVAPNKYTGLNVTESISSINDGVVLAITSSGQAPQDYQWEVGYSATTGAFLWNQNRSVAQAPGQTTFGLMGPVSSGVYTEFNKATMQYYGFSMTTGQQLWGPTTPLTHAESSYSFGGTATDSIFMQEGITGVYAFNLADGKPAWSWEPPPAGLQNAFPNYPVEGISPIAAGGMIFAATSNTHGDELFRGGELYGINAATGAQVWSVDGFYVGAMAVADGYLVAFNGYDNQIYGFGMGQTATTVTATPGVGNVVTIQGTVTDQSPGQTCLGIPAAGTPAISDASMSDWMAYLYMQQPKPTSATGVPVTLTAMGSNGQTINIGTVTSDVNGQFKIAWTPPSNDLYTITASFAGSNSYFSSSAATGLSVSGTTSGGATGVAGLSTDSLGWYIIGATVVIVIAIAIAVIILRRKK